MLTVLDRVKELRAFVEALEHAVVDERVEGLADVVLGLELELCRRWEPAPRHEARQVAEGEEDLAHAHRAISTSEKRQHAQRDRRDRRDAIHPGADLEGDLRNGERIEGLRVAEGLAERGAQGEGLAEGQLDASVVAAEVREVLREPDRVLGLLDAAAILIGVVGNLRDLVVGDRDRQEDHVVALATPIRVDDVGEESVARGQHLAGPRAPALDVPLEWEALLHEEVDVGAQHEFVDGVVRKRAADEEDAGPSRESAHRKEVHVDAAGGVGRGHAVFVEQAEEHHVIDVRLVGR